MGKQWDNKFLFWEFIEKMSIVIFPNCVLIGIPPLGKLLGQLFSFLGKFWGVFNLVIQNWDFLGCVSYYIIPDWDLYGLLTQGWETIEPIISFSGKVVGSF